MMRLIKNPKPWIIALLVVAAGCVMWNELTLRAQRPRFSHQIHLDQGLDCENCHEGATTTAKAGMPDLEFCQSCHESEAAVAKYLTPFAPGGKPQWSAVTLLPAEIVFSHQVHFQKGVKCEQCHQGLAKSDAISPKLRLTMDACQACHEKTRPGAGADCKRCHQKINADWQPPSHLQNWTRTHGQVFRGRADDQMVNRCSLCHQNSYCVRCHQDEKPADHTNQWRTLTHGGAAMDRERCMTCHRADACFACHQSSVPDSHTGAWGPPVNLHCQACHLPLADNVCSNCHRALGPAHFGPARPDDATHRTATDAQCLGCHGPLPGVHPAVTADCRICHRLGGD